MTKFLAWLEISTGVFLVMAWAGAIIWAPALVLWRWPDVVWLPFAVALLWFVSVAGAIGYSILKGGGA